MVAGQFVPTVKGAFRVMHPKRRVTIELHGPDTAPVGAATADGITVSPKKGSKPTVASPKKATTTEAAIPPKSPSPKKGSVFGGRNKEDPVDLAKELKDTDRILIRILKPRKTGWGSGGSAVKDSGDEDSSNGEEEALNGSKANMSESFSKIVDDGWVEYRKYDLDEIEQVELEKATWEANLGRAANKERREFRFASAEEGKCMRVYRRLC
jgi:hypothetical protein